MEMTYYTNMQYYCGCWLSDSKRNELIRQGWIPSDWSRNHFYKENKVPAYSSQIEHNKIKHIGKTIESTKTFLEDSHNKAAFSHIKDEVLLLLKHICPKKLKVDMSYSTGSPDTTAEVFGILAMFPVGYRNHWNIIPDFTAEEFYAEADFTVHGRIFGVQILALALRIILDKNCRRLYNRFKHMK